VEKLCSAFCIPTFFFHSCSYVLFQSSFQKAIRDEFPLQLQIRKPDLKFRRPESVGVRTMSSWRLAHTVKKSWQKVCVLRSVGTYVAYVDVEGVYTVFSYLFRRPMYKWIICRCLCLTNGITRCTDVMKPMSPLVLYRISERMCVHMYIYIYIYIYIFMML
jgi:hypothetical protein